MRENRSKGWWTPRPVTSRANDHPSAEFAAQAQNGEFHPLWTDAERVVPDLLQQLLSGQGLARMADERLEELELELGEADHRAVHPHFAGRPVDLEIAGPVRGGLLDDDRGGGVTAAQQGLDAGAELLDAERFGEVVVGPAGEPADLVLLEGVGRKNKHRHLGEVADPLENLPAVHLGQADVEHHQVRAIFEEVA
jgi:hypothetical protein